VALNIKNPETDELAAELARRMGHGNKARAIHDAVRAQLASLEYHDGDAAAKLLDVMRTEVWPLLPNRSPITKQDREAILGYTPETGI